MKLAILIEGDRDSGKSSTIKEFINIFGNKNIKQMKRGWQRIYLNPDFKNLKLHVYCVPASPSETNITLSQRFNSWTYLPNVLIVAVQPNGQHCQNTKDYLHNHNYNILPFPITNVDGIEDWKRFDNKSKQNKLTNRAGDINQKIRQFIKGNNIV